MYCLWHCEDGDNHSFVPPETGHWSALVEGCQKEIQAGVPALLAGPSIPPISLVSARTASGYGVSNLPPL
jgi:hypothetical protein